MKAIRMHATRGVALIEAVVALAVMAFGMLGVAAMQASLRQSVDLARQRAEAVRLAQESIESMRAYSVINSVAGRTAYADLMAPVGAETITQTNATYTRTVFIAPDAGQNRKTVDVLVTWADRTNATHQVRLSSVIHRVPPELPAALAVPGFGTAAQLAYGRSADIPSSAVSNPDGVTSTFTPPQPSGPNLVTWIFNNASGLITQRCVGSTCTTTGYGARLLSGYVAFSLGSSEPTPTDAETPASAALTVDVNIVNQTLPAPLAGTTTECFASTVPSNPPGASVRAYFCLIQVLDTDQNLWSARSEVTGLALATSVSDTDPSKYRVCRYTPYRNNNAVGSGTAPAILQNTDHPFNYSQVNRNLTNQNFLVIRAGGTRINSATGLPEPVAFDCPDDFVPADPTLNFINSATWHHQPAS